MRSSDDDIILMTTSERWRVGNAVTLKNLDRRDGIP